MSSALKDARWQLASEMAVDDGVDFYAADYFVQEGYLDAAQNYLSGGASREEIDALAAKFRSHD